MSKDRFEDETQTEPMKLLARYRELCERAGSFRAIREPLPRDLQQQLSDFESELQTRLWLSGRSANEGQRPASGSERATRRASKQSAGDEPPAFNPASFPLPPMVDLTPTSSGLPLRPPAGKGETRLPSPGTHSLNGVAEVYSDGSCLGNPGPGGYGTIVRVHGRQEKEIFGGKARTTNNEMELTGAIEGLKAATSMGASEIKVVSDSEYLVKGMNSWMKGWLRNGWKTRTGGDVKNRELWEQLHRLSQGKTVTWEWVAGHAGHAENERCNTLAIAAAQEAARARQRGGRG